MTHTRSGTIAIIRQRSDDDSDSSGEISFVEDFFDLLLTDIESCTTTYSAIDDIDCHSGFLRTGHSIRECIILLRISATISSERYELRMNGVYLGFDFGSSLFLGLDRRSASHSIEILGINMSYQDIETRKKGKKNEGRRDPGRNLINHLSSYSVENSRSSFSSVELLSIWWREINLNSGSLSISMRILRFS
jgi:hypothetical protein